MPPKAVPPAPPENKVAVRAGGLHAAFAQCAALRRMLTALRVNRLLVRWRVAAVFIAANERLTQAARTTLAMEDAVVEVHKRSEVAAQRAALVASQRVYLSAMCPHMLGTPSLTHAFLQWQNTCRAIEANRAVMAQTALRRWQSALGESLRAALKAKQGQLALTRKLMQKPVQLERELADMGAELLQAKEALEQCQRRLLVQQQKTSGAEARIKTLRNEVQAERRRSGGGGGAGGGGASSTPRSKEPAVRAREEREQGDQVGELKQSLANAVADKHRLDGQLSGQRAKVTLLLEQRRKSAAQRLTSILLLRAHQALGPALKRWQAASLERAGEYLRSGSVVADTSTLAQAGGAAGDVRQSRIVALQRELLDREAQLGQAHQASLNWREERSALRHELADARAELTSARGQVADATMSATAAAERESREAIHARDEEIRAMTKRIAAADKGWRETAAALEESERMLAGAHGECEAAKRERDAARKAARAAETARDEMLEARQSESAAAAAQIAQLEAAAEQAVIRKRDRPIMHQREVDGLQKEAERLRAQLAEERKKLVIQQRRTLDAESRMESLQREVGQYRNLSKVRRQNLLASGMSDTEP